jgi:hypothetical protein
MAIKMLIPKVRKELARPLNAREKQMLATFTKVWQSENTEHRRKFSEASLGGHQPSPEAHKTRPTTGHTGNDSLQQPDSFTKKRQIYIARKRKRQIKMIMAHAAAAQAGHDPGEV